MKCSAEKSKNKYFGAWKICYAVITSELCLQIIGGAYSMNFFCHLTFSDAYGSTDAPVGRSIRVV